MHAPSFASPSGASGIEIHGLEFAYPSGFRLVVDSLTIARGEQVLLAGSSGSGKSTLLHLAAGIERSVRGSVFIEGTDILALSGASRDLFRGRRIGMIFQTFNLLHGFTAIENVMMPLMLSGFSASEQRSRARDALSRLGIERHEASVDALSVGQQQRVAVARAIAGGPAVVLADEPTASLDAVNASAAIDLIKEAAHNAGASLILTSHDPAMRSRFERVVDVSRYASSGATR